MGATVGIIVLFIVGWFFLCSNEADTYNKLCSPAVEATTQDAMFSELRVDGTCAKNGKANYDN